MSLTARLTTAAQVSAEMGRAGRMTGAQLAKRSGVPYRTLMRCLNAERPFTVDELASIAAVLDVDISTLIGASTTPSTGRKTADSQPVAAAA